jgi:hypothetical protein
MYSFIIIFGRKAKNKNKDAFFSFPSLHAGNDPPLEFICPFLDILYFPHTLAIAITI